MTRRSGKAECLLIVGMLVSGPGLRTIPPQAQKQPSSATAKENIAPVTEVVGESWISHLNRPFGDTSMGKTGYLGPSPSQSEDAQARNQSTILVGCATQAAVLHGKDLYRLNCRGCHGEAGLGAPPEINSVIGPVRAASVPLVLARMKTMGVDMSRAQAAQLAQQAQAALLDRLHNGGTNMPAFPQLDELEIRSILAYLQQLAGVPGVEKAQLEVHESPERIGELIVKSTCHICHSAAGPDLTPQQLWDGGIPPLETLTTRKSQSGLIQKVTQGAPVIMGTPPTPARGRMPVFYYLTPQEAADVYLYLTLHPPSQWTVLNVAANQPQVSPDTGTARAGTPPSLATNSPRKFAVRPQRLSKADTTYLVLFFAAGLLAALLVTGGFAFTLWEFRKLSVRHPGNATTLTVVATPVPAAVAGKQDSCRTVFRRDRSKRAEPVFVTATRRFREKEK